jgi:hypothetical protein
VIFLNSVGSESYTAIARYTPKITAGANASAAEAALKAASARRVVTCL